MKSKSLFSWIVEKKQFVKTLNSCSSAKSRDSTNSGQHEEISEFRVIFKTCPIEIPGI
jgi:hypothetical protein